MGKIINADQVTPQDTDYCKILKLNLLLSTTHVCAIEIMSTFVSCFKATTGGP